MRDGIHTASVVRIGVGALLVLAIVVGASFWLTSRWDSAGPSAPAASPRTWISGPVLETAPQTDLAQYLAQKGKLIDSYAWIDRDAGIARIPVDVAMQALAAQAAASARQGAKP